MKDYDWVTKIMNAIDEVILEDLNLENKEVDDEYSYIKGKK